MLAKIGEAARLGELDVREAGLQSERAGLDGADVREDDLSANARSSTGSGRHPCRRRTRACTLIERIS
jgi:hypothetical protein